MSTQQLGSEQILRATEYLCKYASHVPQAKVDWKPDNETKSVREILQHTVEVNQHFLGVISGNQPKESNSTAKPNSNFEVIVENVRMSGQQLANVIRALSDDELRKPRTSLQGNPLELSRAIATAGMHISYHWGQISYLQTLWGDTTDHF